MEAVAKDVSPGSFCLGASDWKQSLGIGRLGTFSPLVAFAWEVSLGAFLLGTVVRASLA